MDAGQDTMPLPVLHCSSQDDRVEGRRENHARNGWPPADGTFEQPFADTLFRTAAQLADLSHQGRHMNRITEPSGQGQAVQLLIRFHVKTKTWQV